MSITLKQDMSNIPAFVEDLFAPGNRDYDAVFATIRKGRFFHSFVDSGSRALILRAWLAAWQKSQGDSYDSDDFRRCPEPDKVLLAFLARYIKDHDLELMEPELDYKTIYTARRASYRSTDNKWHHAGFISDKHWAYGSFNDKGEVADDPNGRNRVVARFLNHLFHGSHMVFVSAAADLKGTGTANFRNLFDSNFSGEQIRDDPGNSHYTRIVNTSGLYYLDIPSNTLPASNPLLLAFLTGQTADFATNSFVQHEGWQAQPRTLDGGPRHNADFQASKDFLWNFSTYGASVHSEKRSTTVFVAPGSFDRRIDSATHMPLYVGAGSLQSWMNPDLLDV